MFYSWRSVLRRIRTLEASLSTEPALIVERDGPIVVLTMNRPHALNALDLEMLARMADAWTLWVSVRRGCQGNFRPPM